VGRPEDSTQSMRTFSIGGRPELVVAPEVGSSHGTVRTSSRYTEVDIRVD
jgi:hypothetical protein